MVCHSCWGLKHVGTQCIVSPHGVSKQMGMCIILHRGLGIVMIPASINEYFVIYDFVNQPVFHIYSPGPVS